MPTCFTAKTIPLYPQLPPVFIPAPTIRESMAGPFSVMGVLLILAGIAMAAAYFFADNNIVQQRSFPSFGPVQPTGDSYRSRIAPLLHIAGEKYNI